MASHRLDHQPEELLITQIRDLKRQVSELRTLQLQGNDALSLGIIEGYFTIDIPTTITPEVAVVDVTAPSGTTIMIGNLFYSTFYTLPAGGETPTGVALVNQDGEDLFEDHLTWECFLADSTANPGDPPIPAGWPWAEVEADTVRITAKLRSYDTWSFPVGPANYVLVFYQIRATIM